jgi:ArsR family transcriptional regulator, arsenate/arsenite/antimonite-responsive transcriptional repressor
MCYTGGMETIASLSRIALVLSDPIRLQILDILVAGRDASSMLPMNPEHPQALCPRDIRVRLNNDIAASDLSYHLKELREAGLIHMHKTGKFNHYTPDLPVLEQFLEALRQRYASSSLLSEKR